MEGAQPLERPEIVADSYAYAEHQACKRHETYVEPELVDMDPLHTTGYDTEYEESDYDHAPLHFRAASLPLRARRHRRRARSALPATPPAATAMASRPSEAIPLIILSSPPTSTPSKKRSTQIRKFVTFPRCVSFLRCSSHPMAMPEAMIRIILNILMS